MKKQNKSTLTKLLDKEVSRIVRARGVCAHCKKGAEEVTLQCSHIIGRRNLSTRFDLENCLALCYRCHFHWWHKEPVLADKWLQEYLGEVKYQALISRAAAIKKWTLEEMQSYLAMLRRIK